MVITALYMLNVKISLEFCQVLVVPCEVLVEPGVLLGARLEQVGEVGL